MKRLLVLSCLIAACAGPPLIAAEVACRAPTEVTLRIRFARQPVREVLLQSSPAGGFRLLDAVSRVELWSVAMHPPATQRVAGMDASFGASFAAVHLDADGVHDRLYAGDRAGRLWRFDLHTGALPAEWMTATILADLGAPGGRGFIAAPDVSRIVSSDGRTWLNIAIGSASTGPVRSDNRFYVIRDALAGPASATTLTEADLTRLSPPLGTGIPDAPGYYLPLGSAQVVAQALTVGGNTWFSAVEDGRSLLDACGEGMIDMSLRPTSVSALRSVDGAAAAHAPADQPSVRRAIADSLPGSTAVELATTPDADGRLSCQLGTVLVHGCSLDTRPARTWWRREDAD